jgi:esterase/lipase superfamily enzyme
MWLFNQFHHCVRHEVVPAIRTDLGGAELPILAAGASIGAFNALAVLCRFPDVFRAAVGMSGTYRIQRFLDHQFSQDLFFASPLDFVPGLEGEHLDLLRTRFAILASGQGDWEDVDSSWDAGAVLGSKGVPNRVDAWGEEWPHEWHTWRRMLPQYLEELL